MLSTPLKAICSWMSNKIIPICIGIETNKNGMNFRISNSTNFNQFIEILDVPAKTNKEAEKVFFKLENLLNEVTKQKGRPYIVQGTAFSAAGPIWNNSVVLSNWNGPIINRTFHLNELSNSLFPKDKTIFLNDLEASGYGLSILANIEKDKIFKQLWPENSPKETLTQKDFTRAALLQMKTGLGASIIVKNSFTSKPFVIATELGHIQIPSINSEERPLYQFLSNYLYKGSQQPEYEDIASERGISNVYNYYKFKFGNNIDNSKLPSTVSAKEIIQKARNGDKISLKVLSTCFQHFIRAAKSIGVCMSVDTIFLGRNSFDSNWYMNVADLILKEEFYSFIQPEWIKTFRIYTQVKETNLNLLGVSYMAHNIANQ